MSKFSVDLTGVANVMSKRAYKLADVQDKIEKIAFDVVRFRDGNLEEHWRIEAAEDGTPYIIALFSDEEKVATASIKSPWQVVAKSNDLHFFYKKEHLCKVASSVMGFSEADVELARKYLPEKLASNPALVQSLFKTIDEDSLKNILSKYPELA